MCCLEFTALVTALSPSLAPPVGPWQCFFPLSETPGFCVTERLLPIRAAYTPASYSQSLSLERPPPWHHCRLPASEVQLRNEDLGFLHLHSPRSLPTIHCVCYVVLTPSYTSECCVCFPAYARACHLSPLPQQTLSENGSSVIGS